MRVVDTESLMRDYRSALADGAELPLVVSGGSMRPFLAPGRDTVYLRAPDRPLRRGDIAFYRAMEILRPSRSSNSTHPVSMLNLQALASYFIILSS